MADICVSFRVSGRVQGVWFRGWTQKEAMARGLSGWVRNHSDGSIAGVVAGPPEEVNEFIAALHGGPPAARVDAVDWSEAKPIEDAGFRILR
ncbi:MAG: acylphosphatase [Pseudomonadota bacterium]